MASMIRANPANITRHWKVFCNDIGSRVAGTDGEQHAADYIEKQFVKYGLANTHQHAFAFPGWNYSKCRVLACTAKRKRILIKSSMPMCYTLGTKRQGVRGQLAYLQSGTELDFKQATKGRIGLLIGALSLGEVAVKERLVRSGLAALIVVDSRIPCGWSTASGAAPQWVEDYDIPTVGISFLDAVDLVRQMPLTVHVTIHAKTFEASSQNIIGEMQGTHHPDQVVVVTAHHDCVHGTVGAHDNASGVVFILELSRILSRRRPRRTIRFISYGVEENLSLGAYLYTQSLTAQQRKSCVLAINADGVGSSVGTDKVHIVGTHKFEALIRRCWAQCNHPANIVFTVNPYGDQFPMNICGVPSLWLSRPSILSIGHWQLHSEHDNLANVSRDVLGRTINTTAMFLQHVAQANRLPFTREIDTDMMKQIRTIAKQTYHHPWSVSKFTYR